MRVTPDSSAARVARYRAKLREQGLRPVQLWVPDTTSAEFRARWRRSASRLRRSEAYQRDLEFLEGASAF